MDGDRKDPRREEEQQPTYVPASPIKRTWAWVAVVYVLICTALYTYFLTTGRTLTGQGPLMLCPALAGLGVSAVLRYRSGKARGGRLACAALTGACAVLLLFNLWVGIPALLWNFGG